MMHSFGLLKGMVGASLSPHLFSLIAEGTGQPIAYGVFQVPAEGLPGVLPALRALNITGMNVTMPHKQAIMPYLDTLSDEARRIGAVNTVKLTGEGCEGHNTDCYGFLAMLRQGGVEVRGRRFLMCGMSGAGRAIYQALAGEGAAEVLVASTDPAKGVAYDSLPGLAGEWDAVVNCTPLGMYPDTDSCVIGPDVMKKFGAAVDIVYNPAKTKFLRTAETLGLKTLGGLPMLVYQGLKSHAIWTGGEVDMALGEHICTQLAGRFQP